MRVGLLFASHPSRLQLLVRPGRGGESRTDSLPVHMGLFRVGGNLGQRNSKSQPARRLELESILQPDGFCKWKCRHIYLRPRTWPVAAFFAARFGLNGTSMH